MEDNNESQKHRPAVAVIASPSERLKKQLQRATDIEKQLATFKKSSEEKAAKLRSQLCEILSDLLISDPLFALNNDCAGWLWRSCFYAPIGVLRSRVSREKRKQGPNLPKLEHSFKKFLNEAITLYDYLVKQYQSKLIPFSSNENSQDSTQDSSFDMATSSDGVVPGLYRLYIHMGDLNRYAQSLNKAETCYLNASKLAPGMGNPYNQLAVVAQLKDANMSCVALYWYARSLLASHDSFETSSSNLERMFVLNRDYLKEHSRDPKAPILPSTPTNTNHVSNKKAAMELARAQKAAASKSCLVHFVDLHYDLFKGADNEVIREKIANFAPSMDSLLQASAFGDSLLCKMVTISAFSVVITKQRKTGTAKTAVVAAKTFLFSFGACLVKRLIVGLQKLLEKTGKNAPSIRLLVPFVLVCDFIDEMYNDTNGDDSGSDDNDLVTNMKNFWKHIVEAANLVVQVSDVFEIPLSIGGTNTEASSSMRLKEYQLLRGFRPFPFLNGDYPRQDAFIAADEAVEVLELTMSMSQESTGSTSSGENGMKVGKFLGFCNRASSKSSVPISQNGNLYIFSDGYNNGGNTDDMVQPMQEDRIRMDNLIAAASNEEQNEPTDANEIPVVEEDEAGDVVVYKVPKTGGGPALLVPGALLTMDNNNESSKSHAVATVNQRRAHDIGPASPSTPAREGEGTGVNGSSRSPLASAVNEKASTEVNMEEPTTGAMEIQTHDKKLAPPPPPGILPPPGFGIPVATAVATSPGMINGPSGVYAPTMPVHPMPVHTMPPPLPTAPSHPGQVCSGMPISGVPPGVPPPFTQGMTLGQSMQWFGGPAALQTNNPFASTPANPGFTNNPNPVFEPEATTVEGTALLDSGLLNSLWLEENAGNKTKNPFATNF